MNNYFRLLVLAVCVSCSSPSENASWALVEGQGACRARSECAFAEASGKFYLMGGRNILGVDIYDPETNKWSVGADAPIEMHHFQAVTYQEKVYVMGALTGGYPREDPVPVIHIYDPAVDQWVVGDSIPSHRRRGAAGVLVHDDMIYMACGIQDGHYEGHVSWLDRYDPATGIWEELPDAPRPRDHFQLAAVGETIFVAGGRRSSAKTGEVFELTVGEVDAFDTGNNTWTPGLTEIPTQRAGCTALGDNGQFVIIGGESGAMEEGHYDVEVFNPAEGSWFKAPKLVDGRHGTQAILFEDKIYFVAGAGNRGGGPELTSMEVIPSEAVFGRP